MAGFARDIRHPPANDQLADAKARIAALERAAAPLVAMCKAATANGYGYIRGNPRPFEILPDGRFAIDFHMIADIVAVLASSKE